MMECMQTGLQSVHHSFIYSVHLILPVTNEGQDHRTLLAEISLWVMGRCYKHPLNG